MTDIEQLIERLENATGPDRELDGDIAVLLGYRYRQMARCGLGDGRVWAQPGEHFSYGIRPPEFSGSLDAAVTLYPVIPDRIPSDPRLAAIEALRARQAKENA